MSKQRKAVAGSFVIERIYDAKPAQVFAAWAQPEAKAAWFCGTRGEWTEQLREFDFRVGGHERLVGAWNTRNSVSDFSSTYYDIVPDQRIVYCYAMKIDEVRISVSLATIEFKAVGAGTQLRFSEQAVFLDGYDDAGSRERGTAALMDQLGVFLRR